MGFFAKKKVTVEKIAYMVAEVITASDTQQQISKLLKESGQKPTISDQQKKEIVAFQMFAATKGIQLAIGKQVDEQEILAAFHRNMYSRISRFHDEQVEFEKLIQDRYQAYYEALTSDSKDTTMTVGRCFIHYFFSHSKKKEESGLLIIGSAVLFQTKISLITEFIEEVLAKFELIDV